MWGNCLWSLSQLSIRKTRCNYTHFTPWTCFSLSVLSGFKPDLFKHKNLCNYHVVVIHTKAHLSPKQDCCILEVSKSKNWEVFNLAKSSYSFDTCLCCVTLQLYWNTWNEAGLVQAVKKRKFQVSYPRPVECCISCLDPLQCMMVLIHLTRQSEREADPFRPSARPQFSSNIWSMWKSD